MAQERNVLNEIREHLLAVGIPEITAEGERLQQIA